MATFHPGHHPLHGVTCAVDTTGPRLFVGRIGSIDGGGVVLMGADLFEETPGGPSKADYLARAARFGVWERHGQVLVTASEVRSVRPLSEFAGPA
jgi:hypothetical protein